MMAVNLSASTYFVPDSTSMQYLNYGAAVSKVKIKFYCYPLFLFSLCFVLSTFFVSLSQKSSWSRAPCVACLIFHRGMLRKKITKKFRILQVEVNLLTGETRILQADIIYDCGHSMNPAVDLGQVGLISTVIYSKTRVS